MGTVEIGLGMLDSDSGSGLGGGATGTGTIAFEIVPAAGVTVTETDGDTTVSEDGTTTTDEYAVVLTSRPTDTVVIAPVAGVGVTVDTGTIDSGRAILSFTTGTWNMAQMVTVMGVADNTDTPNREVTISHVASSLDSRYHLIDIASVTATVVDDDATTVTLADSPTGDVTEGDNKSITVTLGRSLVTGESLVVPLTFAGAATLVTDYTLVGTDTNGIAYTRLDGSGGDPTVTFTGPASDTATIMLNAATDNLDDEGTESVQIGFGTLVDSSLTGGTTEVDNLDDFNIQEPLRVSIAGGTAVTEGSPAVFTVTVNRAPTAVLTVNLTVADDGTSDFVAGGNEGADEATIAIGTTTTTYEVATEDDSTDEANGMVTVTLMSGDGYATGTPSVAIVAVNDNDVAVTASVRVIESDGDTTVSEDGTTTTDEYGVVLTTGPTAEVTITLTAGTGVTVSANSLTFATTNWGFRQTVTVTGVADNTDTPNREVTISHAADSTDTTYDTDGSLSINNVEVTVVDDDATTVTLADNPTGNVTEGDNKSITVTLGRSLVTGESLVVPLTFAGAATLVTDYTLVAHRY